MCKQELRITSKPSFYDALLLSNRSPQPTKDTSFQSIPICKKTIVSIRYRDDDIQLTYHGQSLQIFASNRELSEEEVLEVLHNFVVKEGNRVTYLRIFPNDKFRRRKRKGPRVIAECKKREVE
jgi:hypothetical protein